MILLGHITELGIGDAHDGVEITVGPAQRIAITGLTHDQVRRLGHMLYHSVKLTIQSEDDRAQFNEEDPLRQSFSNYDPETGIKKTGEI